LIIEKEIKTIIGVYARSYKGQRSTSSVLHLWSVIYESLSVTLSRIAQTRFLRATQYFIGLRIFRDLSISKYVAGIRPV